MIPKVLLVEDEIYFQETLTEILNAQGFEVIALETVAGFDQWYPRANIDLAVLDRTLPDGDGLEILRRIRESSSLPVVMLSGLGHVDDKVIGLEADADHYLVKPVDIRELLSIIKRLLRGKSQRLKKSCAWRLDINDWVLYSPYGIKIFLTHREFLLLQCFIRKKGDVVHRDNIIKALGFDPMVYDMRRLETLVSRLRKKVDQSTTEAFNFQTVYGNGYALHADINLFVDEY
ncbi:MAG: response regulator transcription factor [Fluviibacter phosphoraccumulans]